MKGHQHAGSGGRRQGLNSKENQTERTKYGILGSVTTIPLINNRYDIYQQGEAIFGLFRISWSNGEGFGYNHSFVSSVNL